jgi:hypothetical protein
VSVTKIRMSEIPANQWMDVLLVNVPDQTVTYSPEYGYYVSYEAVWAFEKDPRVFRIVFPVKKLNNALRHIKRSANTRTVFMRFKRDEKHNISIAQYQPL